MLDSSKGHVFKDILLFKSLKLFGGDPRVQIIQEILILNSLVANCPYCSVRWPEVSVLKESAQLLTLEAVHKHFSRERDFYVDSGNSRSATPRKKTTRRAGLQEDPEAEIYRLHASIRSFQDIEKSVGQALHFHELTASLSDCYTKLEVTAHFDL